MGRKDWPRCPVIYEIYPRSFLDTTGSGAGDLNGILQNLDHVADLGADAIWIAPFYHSPLEDGGYDIESHCEVDPALGNIDTFRKILDRAHDAGLKVLTDQVLNHTSKRHRWFDKSARREEGFDDLYVWRDPKSDGTPPNNWMSYFGTPAWTWDHRREQYYCHQFLPCQPNLNLRNTEVQKALQDQMAFWRDLGVDGFRLDAVTAYLYDETFADNPVATPDVRKLVAGPFSSPYARQDHVYDLLPGDGAAYCEKVRQWAGEDLYLLGEINVGNRSVAIANSFTETGRLDAAYTLDFAESGFSAKVVANVIARMQESDPGQGGRVTMWLSSHDQARHLSRDGDGSARDARFMSLACGVLPGPWMIYQGEELGLPQPDLSRAETGDPFDLLFWPDGPGRDGARVPLPWTEEGATRGFTNGTPWRPMRWETGISVAAQKDDPGSVLAFYRNLLALRREYCWTDGEFLCAEADGSIFHLVMKQGEATFQAVLNFGKESVPITPVHGTLLVATEDAVSASDLPPRSGGIWLSA